MLEKVNLLEKKDKKTYKRRLPELQNRLYMLQKATWDAGMPVAIIFEGWDAAGKGSSIQILTSRLDPRGFKLYPIREARTYEKKHPWLWRFWLKIPARGEIAIFDRSWYGRVLVERVEGFVQESEWRRAYRDIVDFERTLADDGTLIFKFFLHISKEEQKKRFKKLLKDPLTAWHVEAEDWEHHAKYDDYVRAIEEMLERTETEWGPWTIVEATDQRHTRLKIIETITLRLEDRLQKMGALPVTPPVLDVAQTEEKPETIPAEADSTTIENSVPENTRKARKSRSKKSDTFLPEDTTAKAETNPIPNSEEGN